MESRLSRQMKYWERYDPDLGIHFVRSDVTPQTIQALQDQAELLNDGTSGSDELVPLLYKHVAEFFQQRNPMIISPVVIGDQVFPLVVVSLMGNPDAIGKPEMNFQMVDSQAFDLIDLLYPEIDGCHEENELREEYKNTLEDHLRKGDRIAFFPSRQLN